MTAGGAGQPTDGEHAGGFEVVLEQEHDYRFRAEFDQPGLAPLIIDEPAPLGAGEGPNASRLLGAAIGHCLSASLLFCLTKARVPVGNIRTTVNGQIAREERNRLRVAGITVRLDADIAEEDRARAARCLELFEDFCIVTASVRRGVDVEVEVSLAGRPVSR